MTTEVVARLRAHAARDNCVSHNWGETPLDAGCDCSDAADELERLEREKAEWAGVAATRNVNIALIAEERDKLRTLLRQCEPYLSDMHGNDVALLGEVRRALYTTKRHDDTCPALKSIGPAPCSCGADDAGGERG